MRKENSLLIKTKLFKGLADRSRLSLLESLIENPKCVTDLVEETGLSQPNVSSHLKCLEECGLIKKERKWKHVYYSVKDKKVSTILSIVAELAQKNKKKILECANY